MTLETLGEYHNISRIQADKLSNRKTILMYLVNRDIVKLLKVLLSLSSADGVWEKSFLTGSNALLLR